LAHLLYEKPYHTKNPITHIKRYFKVYHSIHDGLLRKTMIAIETGEERKRKIEKDTELFYIQQEEAKQLKEKADAALEIFKKLGWKITYKGILINDTICW
jgi:hypothetical protein